MQNTQKSLNVKENIAIGNLYALDKPSANSKYLELFGKLRNIPYICSF